MSATQVISRDPKETYAEFRVRAMAFLDGLSDVVGDMQEADRLILEDTGVVDGGRRVTLVLVKNSLDSGGEG